MSNGDGGRSISLLSRRFHQISIILLAFHASLLYCHRRRCSHLRRGVSTVPMQDRRGDASVCTQSNKTIEDVGREGGETR